MELSLLLAENIAAMFLMGLVGYVIVKIKILKEKDSKVISKIIVYVILPCVIVNAFQMEYSADKMKGFLIAIIASSLIHAIMIPLTRALSGPLHLNAIEKASIVYSNAGNLIIPLVAAVLGAEWVFYTCAYIVVQTLLMWTHGKMVICQEREKNFLKILNNPNLIAMFLGLLLFLLKITLPPVIGTCVAGFANMVGPASMLVIGMLMGNVDMKWVFCQKRPYFICFCRLIVIPLITIFIFRILLIWNLSIDMREILLIVLLAASAPVATTITQLAQIYDKDSNYASIINAMSVICCIFTMPLMVFIYEYLSH